MLRAKAMLMSMLCTATCDGVVKNGNPLHEGGDTASYVCANPTLDGEAVHMLNYSVEYVQDTNGKDIGIRLWMFSNDPTFRLGNYINYRMGQNREQRSVAESSYSRKLSRTAQTDAAANKHVTRAYRNIATIEELAMVLSNYGQGSEFADKFKSEPRGKCNFYSALTEDAHPLNPDNLFNPLHNLSLIHI